MYPQKVQRTSEILQFGAGTVKPLNAIKFLLSCLACSLFFLPACAGTLKFGPEGELTDPAQILTKLDERAQKYAVIQAEAKVKIRSPEQSGTVDAFLTAVLPETLRLGVLDFFGRPVADVLALPDHFQVHDVSRQTVYLGEPTAENLGRILYVPVSPRDAVHLVLGSVPRNPEAKASMVLDRESSAYRLTLISQDGVGEVQTIWVDTETLRVIRAELRSPGGGYNVSFGDFQRVQNVDIPFESDFSAVDAQGRELPVGMTVIKRDVTLNGRIPRRVFEPILPSGARVIDLGEGAPAMISIPLQKAKEDNTSMSGTSAGR